MAESKDQMEIDEEWTEWTVKNAFDFPTTAIIRCRQSINKFHVRTVYNALGDWGDEDDIIDKVLEYNKINIHIIPQIGLRAGIVQKWTFIKPGKITYDTNNEDDNVNPRSGLYLSDTYVPKEKELIDKLLKKAHALYYKKSDLNDNVNIIKKNQNKDFYKLPLILNNEYFCELLNIPQLIGGIILELLGVIQLKINFLPNNIFDSSLCINIINGMNMNEINSLIITNLFIKYNNKNIKSIPEFRWSNNKGIYSDIFDKYYEKYSLNEYTLIFDGIKNDNFGLPQNKQINNINNNFIILNIVGYGFKVLYFKDFKNIKFNDLIKEFYNFTNIDNKNNNNNNIIAIYPYYFNKKTNHNDKDSLIRETFKPHLRPKDWEKYYKNKQLQNKTLPTFNHEKYKNILNKSLFDLNINLNGCLIEMYEITGPCIQATYCSMVGYRVIIDINPKWNLNTFKMYASKFGSVHNLRQSFFRK